jgi:hypothetical protein
VLLAACCRLAWLLRCGSADLCSRCTVPALSVSLGGGPPVETSAWSNSCAIAALSPKSDRQAWQARHQLRPIRPSWPLERQRLKQSTCKHCASLSHHFGLLTVVLQLGRIHQPLVKCTHSAACLAVSWGGQADAALQPSRQQLWPLITCMLCFTAVSTHVVTTACRCPGWSSSMLPGHPTML